MIRNNAIQEMARIDDPDVSVRTLEQCEVWVYSESNPAVAPHFHFLRRTGTPFEMEIIIPDMAIYKSVLREGIDDEDCLTWTGLENEHEMLFKWLDERNSDYNEMTNREVLIATWNQNNRNNQIKNS